MYGVAGTGDGGVPGIRILQGRLECGEQGGGGRVENTYNQTHLLSPPVKQASNHCPHQDQK